MLLRWVFLGCSGLFLVQRMRGIGLSGVRAALSGKTGAATLALSLLCLLAVGSYHLAWHTSLGVLRGRKLPWKRSFKVFALTNLGKYLPGGFGHLVGRGILVRSDGVLPEHLLVSYLQDFATISVAAAGLALPLGIREGSGFPHPYIGMALGLILVIGVLVGVFRYRGTLRPLTVLARQSRFWVGQGRSLALDLTGLALCGSAMFLEFSLLRGHWAGPMVWWGMVSAFSMAWLAGFLVPWAPGGLGVREGVLMGLLQAWMDPATATLLAILMRALTTLGDLLAAVIGLALQVRPKLEP